MNNNNKDVVNKDNFYNTDIKVEISRVLCDYGHKPFIVKSYSHRIKKEWEKFTTLSELKKYYKIKKLIKTEKKGWAINSHGKKHEWVIYEAYISEEYAI